MAILFGGGGRATVTGPLVAGNVAILTATGIQDSGVALVTSMAANTVWGNNATSAGPPAALSVLNMGDGSAGAPIYSHATDPTSGLYMPSTGIVALSAGGRRALNVRHVGPGAGYVDIDSNNTPKIGAVGIANVDLYLYAQGTGSIVFRNNNAQNPMFRAGSTTTSSACRLAAIGTATTVAPQLIAEGSDTDIDIALVPKGTGVVSFGTHSALGSETVSGFITIKDAAGNSRKVAVVS